MTTRNARRLTVAVWALSVAYLVAVSLLGAALAPYALIFAAASGALMLHFWLQERRIARTPAVPPELPRFRLNAGSIGVEIRPDLADIRDAWPPLNRALRDGTAQELHAGVTVTAHSLGPDFVEIQTHAADRRKLVLYRVARSNTDRAVRQWNHWARIFTNRKPPPEVPAAPWITVWQDSSYGSIEDPDARRVRRLVLALPWAWLEYQGAAQ